MPFRRAPNCATAPYGIGPSNGRKTVYRLPGTVSTAACRLPCGKKETPPGRGPCRRPEILLLLSRSFGGRLIGAVRCGGTAGIPLGLRGGAVLLLTAKVDPQAGGPAAQFPQVVELRPAGTAAAHDFDAADERRVQRENTLDAFTGADLPHGDRAAGALAVLAREHDTLERLNAAAGAFHDAVIHADGVSGPEFRVVVADVRLVNGAHDGAFVVLHRLFS